MVPLRDVPPAHDGYWRRRDRPRHRRRWSLTRDGLRIDDLFTGQGRHEIVIRWHLSVGASARLTLGTAAVTSAAGAFLMTVEATSPAALAVETRPVATGLASTADAPVLTCRMNADLRPGHDQLEPCPRLRLRRRPRRREDDVKGRPSAVTAAMR